MAVPRNRHSKSRTLKRRTGKSLSMLNLVACEKCGRKNRAHVACGFCGAYKGEVFTDLVCHKKVIVV